MTIGEYIGFRIREARKLKGLTQAELANAAHISVMSVRRYESGERVASEKILDRFATILGVPISYFIFGRTPSVEELVRATLVGDIYGPMPNNVEGVDEVKGKSDITIRQRIDNALDRLNPSGQSKAVERVEELTEIPKYQKSPPPDSSDGG